MDDPWAPSGAGINGGITSSDLGGAALQNATRGDLPAILDGNFGKQFEESFKEFAQRPENKALLEKHQRKEFKKAGRLQRKAQYLDFQEQVLAADFDAQKNIAPFLENRVLRRVINTFCNDPKNDFGKWANNPQVLALLTQAKRMMDEGHMTEDQAEQLMLSYASHPDREYHNEWKLRTKQHVRVGTDQLVSALNEHLQERRKGNDLYKQRRFAEALAQYERALGIVELVVGMSGYDQREIDTNRISCYLNMAAVKMAQKDYGDAVRLCGEALDLDGKHVKALLRRAKALGERHEYAAAMADLERVKDLEPWNLEAEQELGRLRSQRQKHAHEDKVRYAKMFQA